MRLAYFDCPTGIAGDMCLGALVHAGVPLAYLVEKLSLLGIQDEFRLRAEPVYRNGQEATKVYVEIPGDTESARLKAEETAQQSGEPFQDWPVTRHAPHSHPPLHAGHDHLDEKGVVHPPGRHLPEIEQLIQQAGLPERVTTWSLAVFRTLGKAEGAVHAIPPDQVHFHEVGATDAIVDIVGTCLGLDWLDIDQIYCSALPTGGGTVRAAHGLLPVPTPAVLKLWEMRQIPVYSNGIAKELVTPTGAALMATLAKGFGAPPAMTPDCTGLGAGSRDLPIPNILRLWIGEAAAEFAPTNGSLETVTVLETQIDDLTPQAIAYTMEQLLAVGALDVFTQAIGMKKSRSGWLLTVICQPAHIKACEDVLFRETTTLGIRRRVQERVVLQREMHAVQTAYGTVRVKVSGLGQPLTSITNVQPEYEDCAQLARQHHLPWREIHRLALQAWYLQNSSSSHSN